MRNVPLISKTRMTMHELVTHVMSWVLSMNPTRTDYSPVGYILGLMIASKAFRLVKSTFRQGGKTMTNWNIVRTGSISDVLGSGAFFTFPYHEKGIAVHENVRWRVNTWLFAVMNGVIQEGGTKVYTSTERTATGKEVQVKRSEKIYLKEYISRWEFEALKDAIGVDGFTFFHSPESNRGGRINGFPTGIRTVEGDRINSFPTLYSGDVSYLLEVADERDVDPTWVENRWIPKVMSEFGLTRDQILKIGSDQVAAVRFILNPTGKVRGLGKKKRNAIQAVAQCYHIVVALKTGKTRGRLSRDGHADGWFRSAVTFGCYDLVKFFGETGTKVYAHLGSFIKKNLPKDGLPWFLTYLSSPEWAKAALIPMQYTSRYLAWTFITGAGSGEKMLDENGEVLHPKDLADAVIDRDALNPDIADHLRHLSDDQIKALADEASISALNAFMDMDPHMVGVTDMIVARAKAKIDNGEPLVFTFDGKVLSHFRVEAALAWFPADPITGERNLPQISFTIPAEFRALFDAEGWPTRFQPCHAGFFSGKKDEDGHPVLPWENTGNLNTTHTANGILPRIISLSEARCLMMTVIELEARFPGSVQHSRHDAVYMTPGPAYDEAPKIWARNMRLCALEARAAIESFMECPMAWGPMPTEAEMEAWAENIFR